MESDLELYKKEFISQTQCMSDGLSTHDYSQLDKSEKKLVDDFYEFSPYQNPLGLENYKPLYPKLHVINNKEKQNEK